MTHALVGRQAPEQGDIFDRFVVNLQIVNAKIMEGGKHLLGQSVLQRDLERDDVIEKGKDVIAVGAIGRGGHAQIKPRRKVRHDGLVTLGSRAVGLVDDDVVELIGTEIAQMFGDRRTHGKHAGSIAYILASLIGVERIGTT